MRHTDRCYVAGWVVVNRQFWSALLPESDSPGAAESGVQLQLAARTTTFIVPPNDRVRGLAIHSRVFQARNAIRSPSNVIHSAGVDRFVPEYSLPHSINQPAA